MECDWVFLVAEWNVIGIKASVTGTVFPFYHSLDDEAIVFLSPFYFFCGASRCVIVDFFTYGLVLTVKPAIEFHIIS